MHRIKEKYEAVYEIKKSKFICVMIPMENESKVSENLIQLKKEYTKATHYCYAYRINNKEKSNDDGEPAGTAGRPILEFLIKNDLTNILCVVIRYFGGIKLGASGLLRAYIDSCKNTFDICEVYKIVEYFKYRFTIEYKYYDSLNNYLKYCDSKIINSSFEEKIVIELLLNGIDKNSLLNLTNGSIAIEPLGVENIYVLDK